MQVYALESFSGILFFLGLIVYPFFKPGFNSMNKALKARVESTMKANEATAEEPEDTSGQGEGPPA